MSVNIYSKDEKLINVCGGSGSGLPEPEAKDKLLLSTENAETSKLEWSQVDKAKAVEIPLYETKAAAEADIANLSDGQIIATKDEGNELSNPVDVVQDGNMHAVTSNAVANALGKWEEVWREDSNSYILGVKNSLGTWLRIRFSGFISGNISNGHTLLVLPQEWSPVISSPNRLVIGVDTPTARINAILDISANGEIKIYFTSNTPTEGTVTVTGIFCDVFMNIR